MIRRVYWSLYFWLVLVSSTAFKLTKAGEGLPSRRLSTFPEECSYPCTHTTVDLLLKKGQPTCPPSIQEAGDKFVTGGGIHLCRALRGEVSKHTVGFSPKHGHFCPTFRDKIDESFWKFSNLTLVLLDFYSAPKSLVWKNE